MRQARPLLAQLAVVLVLAALPVNAAAQPNPQTLRLRAYIHSIYNQHDGNPLGAVNKILQTPEGYLWVFTRDGLLRFDGLRFVRPSTPCTQPIQSQAPAIDGGFWAVCGDKLIRRTADARFVVVTQAAHQPLPPHTLFADRQGRVWILGQTIRYLNPDGSPGRVFETPRAPRPFTAAQDSEGTIWATDGNNVFHLSADRIDRIGAFGAAHCMTPARTGGVLVSTGTSILQLRTGVPPSLVASFPEPAIAEDTEGCLREAADGGVWIARAGKGVALVRRGRIELPAGMTEFGRTVTDIFLDRDGQIWAGTTRELNLFRKAGYQFIPLPPEPGNRRFVYLDSDANLWTGSTAGARRSDLKDSTEHFLTPKLEYSAAGEDEQGTIWMATRQGIGKAVNGTFVAVTDASGRPVANVSAFKQDHLGHLWALAPGVGIYSVTPGRPRLSVDSSTASSSLLISEHHGIWTASADGSVEQHLDGRTITYPSPNPGPRGEVMTLVEDGDSIWIGSASGVERLRGGQATRWTREQGLPGGVRGMVDDRSGHLWMQAGSTLVRASRAELDATPDGQPRPLSLIRIEGIGSTVPLPDNLRNVPAMTSDRLGRLYGFSNPNTVVIINPAALTEPSMFPATILESIFVNNEPVDHSVSNRFVDPDRLDFRYTGLNLRGAESTRFRYRLDGYDADWIDARIQRTATYRNLRSGAYTFHVTAQGPEGLWNETGTSFAFHIVPVFWRTWWFQLSMAVLGLSILGGVYQLRVHQLRRQFHLGLEARVSERTRIARELHDTLLQSFQGVLIHFQAATNLLPGRPDEARTRLETILEQAARAVAEGRDAVQSLRDSAAPSEDLPDALSVLAGQLAGECDVAHAPAMRLNVEGNPRSLRPIVRDDVYRIASEALRNAVRHAQARLIQLDVHYDSRYLQVRVRDDGRGIDEAVLGGRGVSGHWGLPGMRERAEIIGGTLDVRSRLGAGTEIELSLPALKAYAPARRRRFWSRWRPMDTDS